MGCVKNPKILLEDWECPEIVNRKEQVRQIEDSIIKPLINETRPPTLTYVYGASGSGKTFVITKLIKNNLKKIKWHLPTFDFYYFNCKNFGIPSLHILFVNLAMKFTKHLPIKSEYFKREIIDVPLRGWTTDEYKEFCKEIINKRRLSVLLVLDEVDKIGKEKVEDLIYIMRGMNESDSYYGISTILISNNIGLLHSLSKGAFDRISIKIHFSSYGVDDLFNILKVHAKYALEEGSYDDKTLFLIARKVAEVSTSAREAKITLYNLAQMCEEKLNPDLIPKAFDETRKNLLLEEIIKRPIHHKLTLLAVVEVQKKIQKLAHYGKPGLFKYTSNLPTKSTIYNTYKKICQSLGEQPKSYRTFFDIIDDLDRYGLVKTEIRSLGRARGLTTLVRPVESIKTFELLIKKAIGL